MACDAKEIANWFIDRSTKDNRSLSIMSLLKLAYISHGWFLALYDRPLFHNPIEAWKYGPVVRDIYISFKKQGRCPRQKVPTNQDKIDHTINGFLEQIYNIYSSMPPLKLSDLTHVAGGPWDITVRLGGYYALIPDDLIKQHYLSKKQQAELEQHAQ